MTELQTSRYDRIMRRVGDLKGPGSKVAEVIAELFPMIDMENLPGELLALGGTGLAWGNATVTAVAAMSGRVQLFNPEGSGTLMTVSQVQAQNSALNDDFTLGVTNTALSALQATRGFRDSRFGFATLPLGEIRQDVTAVASPNHFRVSIEALFSFKISDENSVACLTPGFGLNVSSIVQNTTIKVAIAWRERAIEPSELLELG